MLLARENVCLQESAQCRLLSGHAPLPSAAVYPPVRGLRRSEEITGAIAVGRGEPSFGLHHVPNRRQDGPRRLLLDQLRVINFTGRVVQDAVKSRQITCSFMRANDVLTT